MLHCRDSISELNEHQCLVLIRQSSWSSSQIVFGTSDHIFSSCSNNPSMHLANSKPALINLSFRVAWWSVVDRCPSRRILNVTRNIWGGDHWGAGHILYLTKDPTLPVIVCTKVMKRPSFISQRQNKLFCTNKCVPILLVYFRWIIKKPVYFCYFAPFCCLSFHYLFIFLKELLVVKFCKYVRVA